MEKKNQLLPVPLPSVTTLCLGSIPNKSAASHLPRTIALKSSDSESRKDRTTRDPTSQRYSSTKRSEARRRRKIDVRAHKSFHMVHPPPPTESGVCEYRTEVHRLPRTYLEDVKHVQRRTDINRLVHTYYIAGGRRRQGVDEPRACGCCPHLQVVVRAFPIAKP
ncbi:hypothetical protein PISMIDRAFT_334362 [Pisolithus microcarpus 441]|uniref:Uncharacterized protein n=1 Tax=Pisolithus microcarpus 441 TaxID=765257 RepID=A0A0C9ZTX2_9AGAM|nr:hypothetical protein PISMIDRAFT_334362 [Pisolithus microcarpus 441]